jgi:hypothetical protein
MDDKPSNQEQAQIERARRLRERINDLKSGTQEKNSDQPKSIKEQIADRASQLKKEGEEQK